MSTGADENQHLQKNRTSPPAPRKNNEATSGAVSGNKKQTEVEGETNDKVVPAQGPCKSNVVWLLLGMATMRCLAIHSFCGIAFFTKVHAPFAGALKEHRKTGTVPVCCTMVAFATVFLQGDVWTNARRRHLEFSKE